MRQHEIGVNEDAEGKAQEDVRRLRAVHAPRVVCVVWIIGIRNDGGIDGVQLRREEIATKEGANAAHFQVGQVVRRTIQELGGTMPEQLPTPEKSIKELETEERKRLRQRAADQSPQLPLFGDEDASEASSSDS